MRMFAYILAIICIIAAVIYFVIPADHLPNFMPGYDPQLDRIHKTHGIAAVIAAVVLLFIGWFVGRR